jgi:hypothetical protein
MSLRRQWTPEGYTWLDEGPARARIGFREQGSISGTVPTSSSGTHDSRSPLGRTEACAKGWATRRAKESKT